VNLIGEHTDYNGGLCLPFALPQRTYAAVGRRDDGVLRVASLQRDDGWEGRIADIRPGSPGGWASYVAGVVAVLAARAGADVLGADVLIDGRVPIGAGLASSAALSCSVAVALRDLVPALAGLDDAALAAAAVRGENEYAGAATGGMDQTVALGARDGHALLIDCRDLTLTQVPWTLPDHEILVIDTRVHHELADGQYAARRTTCERACEILGIGTLRDIDPSSLDDALLRLGADDEAVRRVRHVVTENARVEAFVTALRDGDAERAGALMVASHVSLRDDYEVSCPELDLAVSAALAAGAQGARMTGGGFGGSAIALVAHAHVERVTAAVRAAYAARGWTAPAFVEAAPDGPAMRLA